MLKENSMFIVYKKKKTLPCSLANLPCSLMTEQLIVLKDCLLHTLITTMKLKWALKSISDWAPYKSILSLISHNILLSINALASWNPCHCPIFSASPWTHTDSLVWKTLFPNHVHLQEPDQRLPPPRILPQVHRSEVTSQFSKVTGLYTSLFILAFSLSVLQPSYQCHILPPLLGI